MNRILALEACGTPGRGKYPLGGGDLSRRTAIRNGGRGSAGFTLIELMIVVAIVAILGALAYASYVRYAVKTHRVAAESCLSEYANYMERFYTTNLRYDQVAATGTTSATPITWPVLDCSTPQQTGNNYKYQWITAQLTATTFAIQAIPLNAQLARDTQCGTLTIDQKGQRQISGTGTLDQCW